MKKLILLMGILCSFSTLFAQAPQGINYQLVLRDGNTILANQTVDLLYAIEDANAAILYEEAMNGVTSNAFGQVTIVIGKGTPVIGSFDNIDWSLGGLQFEIEVTVNGTIHSLGRKALNSVPYSLFADKATQADTAAHAGQATSADRATYADSSAVAGHADRATFADSAAVTITNVYLNDLLDVSANPTGNGQLMVWDGSTWIANTGIKVQDSTIYALNFTTHPNTDGSITLSSPKGGANVKLSSGRTENLGSIEVTDTLDQTKVLVEVVEKGSGVQRLFGPSGKRNINLTSWISYGDHGLISLYDSAENVTANFFAGIPDPQQTEGAGLWLRAPNDTSNNRGAAILVGGVNLQLPTGSAQLGGWLDIYGINGNRNITNAFLEYPDFGILALCNSSGLAKHFNYVAQTNAAFTLLEGPNGTNVMAGSEQFFPDRGYLAVLDSAGNMFGGGATIRGQWGGSGHYFATGPNGNLNFQAGSIAGVSPYRGMAEVCDSLSVAKAGMYVDSIGRGVVFGDIKNFRIPHPNKPSKEIWYASIEGPEAAAYVRGTAQLVNGEVEVNFPEHFEAIASPQNMTVLLTPLSADSKGLAVIEKTTTGFKVKELYQGTGNYKLDWEVKCVRKGYENYRVIRNASEMERLDPREGEGSGNFERPQMIPVESLQQSRERIHSQN